MLAFEFGAMHPSCMALELQSTQWSAINDRGVQKKVEGLSSGKKCTQIYVLPLFTSPSATNTSIDCSLKTTRVKTKY